MMNIPVAEIKILLDELARNLPEQILDLNNNEKVKRELMIFQKSLVMID